MTTTWLLLLLFLIYPLIVIPLNLYTSRKIPEQMERRQYKRNHEYVIMLVYLLSPVFLLHLELFLLNEGYSFNDVSVIPLMILFILQIIAFGYGIHRLKRFISGIKKRFG
jgi:uncharacterized membrane protein YidH (DUF202 family)